MIATLLGSSGTTPIVNRPLTSLHVTVGNRSVLIDCGEGTQLSFMKTRVRYTNLAVICFTHYHPDHVLGLPGLLSTINAWLVSDLYTDHRDLLIIGPQDSNGVLSRLLGCVPHSNVNVRFYEVKGGAPRVFDFGDFKIESFPVRHSTECLGYSIMEKRNPRLNVARAEESGIDKKYWGLLQKGMVLDDGRDICSISDGEVRYRKVSYATDTLPFDELKERVLDADLAVLEGMHYDEEEYSRNGAHMLFREAAVIARDAGVKELWLTHFSPALSRPWDGLGRAKEIMPDTSIGWVGMKKEVL